MAEKPTHDEQNWANCLTPAQFRVLRGHGTEPPGSSPLEAETRTGTYACAACGQELFDSVTKYHSGSGWPSFWDVHPGAVTASTDTSFGMVRTEILCARCGSHLGHLFGDGPRPTGQRYCMNGVALTFCPANEPSPG